MPKTNNIISSCYKLTMDKFIECICDKNYMVLGKGSAAELLSNWAIILNEFTELRKDKSSLEIFELQKVATSLRMKANIIDKCVEVLWAVYNRDIANHLKSMGYILNLDWSKKDAYYNQLKVVLSRAKSLVLQAERKELELLKLIEKNKGNGYERKYFDSVNTNLSRFMNFYIDNSKVTVSQWCDMITKYEAYCEVQNAEANNLLRRSV